MLFYISLPFIRECNRKYLLLNQNPLTSTFLPRLFQDQHCCAAPIRNSKYCSISASGNPVVLNSGTDKPTFTLVMVQTSVTKFCADSTRKEEFAEDIPRVFVSLENLEILEYVLRIIKSEKNLRVSKSIKRSQM